MCITLRDFRPHVGLLAAVGLNDLARRICQDYLDAYTNGLNAFVRDVRSITLFGHEARLTAQAGRT